MLKVVLIGLTVLHFGAAQDTFGTSGFLNSDNEFILTSEKLFGIQRYVSTIMDLSIPVHLAGQNGYSTINVFTANARDHAKEWYLHIFPKVVSQAASVSSYGLTVNAIVKRILLIQGKVFSESGATSLRTIFEIKAMLSRLVKLSVYYGKNIKTVVDKIRALKIAFVDDEAYEQRLLNDYGTQGQDANMRHMSQEIANKVKQLDELTEEYEKQVRIELNVPLYAWIPIVGWIVGPTVAGVSRSKQRDLSRQRKDLVQDIKNLEAKLDKQVELSTFVSTHLHNVQDAIKVIDDVIRLINGLSYAWKDIQNDLKLMIDSDALNVKDKSKPVFSFSLVTAQTAWLNLKNKADHWRANAYIAKSNKP